MKYSRNEETGKTHYAGIPFRRELIESLGGRFELTTEPRWISDDIVTSGEEPITTDYETISDRLCLKTENGFEQDTMADDTSIFFRTDLGLVIATGCAHRGMINVIRHAIEVTGEKNLYMVVGGTHLYGVDDERVEKTIEDLRELNPVWLGASHCTGFTAAARMFNAFPDKFFQNGAGSVITFPYEK